MARRSRAPALLGLAVACTAVLGSWRALESAPLRRKVAQRPWFAGLQVVGAMPYLDSATGMGMTATIWNAGAYLPGDEAAVTREVARAHEQGWPHVATVSAMMIPPAVLADRPELLAARRLAIDGSTPRATWVEPIPLTADSNHPLWRAFLREVIRRTIDCGGDGILIDDAIGTYVWDRAVFAEPTQAALRDHLRRRYDAATLAGRFGIADVESLELGAYLRGHGWEAVWRDAPWQLALYDDLVLCLLGESRAFIDELVDDGRRYARERYGREVAFSANLSDLDPAMLPSGNALDFLMIEYHHDVHAGFPPAGRESVMLALARALSPAPPQWVIGTTTAAAMLQMPTADTLMQSMIAGSFAAGGTLCLPPAYAWSAETGPGFYRGNADAMRPYYAFVRDNRFLYEATPTRGGVALVYSLAAALLPGGGGRDSFYGAAYALLNGHVAFEAVVAGIPGLLDARLTDADLAAFATVVLPNARFLGDDDLAAVLRFAAAGGRVVAWGGTAVGDELGVPAERPALVPLLVPGEHPLGAGVFAYANEDAGALYLGARDAATRSRLLGLVGAAGPAAPPTVNAFARADASRQLAVAHLVNLDYRVDGDTLTPTPGFSWPIAAAGGLAPADAQAYLLAADAEPRLLPFAAADGGVAVEVPPLSVHGAVAYLPRRLARGQAEAVLTEAYAALAAARARGAAAAAVETLLARIAAALAEENYFLARDLGRSLSALVAPWLRPRVLFDEAHQERNTMLLERAWRLAPQLTGGQAYWLYFGAYRDAAAAELAIDVNESAELTDPLLAGYDALVLAVPLAHALDGHPFTGDEVAAIHRFVAGGGGLLVLGDAGVNPAVNELVARYGMRFDPRAVYSHAPSGGIGDFPVGGFVASPATSRFQRYVMNWGASLQLGPQAVALGATESDTWADGDGNATQDPGETAGPFVVLAMNRAARVACLADNNFQHDPAWGPEGSMNAPVLTRLLRWLGTRPGPR